LWTVTEVLQLEILVLKGMGFFFFCLGNNTGVPTVFGVFRDVKKFDVRLVLKGRNYVISNGDSCV
jgi:hypothetical protein